MSGLDIFKVSGFVSLLVNGGLGLFVLLKSPKRNLNIRFATFSLCIAFWSVGSAYVNVVRNESVALFLLRSSYIFGVFVPSLFFHFVATFIEWQDKFKLWVRISYFISFLLLCFVFTPHFIETFRTISGYDYRIDLPGTAYIAFAVFFNAVVSGTLLLLIYFYFKQAIAKQKSQLKFIFVGYLFGAIAGLEYFLGVFNILKRPPIDDYLLILTFAAMAYGITKHQLLDIEVIIKKTLVFAGLFTLFMTMAILPSYAFLIIGLDIPMGHVLRFWWFFPIQALLLASVSRPGEKVFVRLTDRFLFQKKIDYGYLLRLAAKGLSKINTQKHHLNLISRFVVLRGRIKTVAIYENNKSQNSFVLRSSKAATNLDSLFQDRIGYDSPIIEYFKNRRRKSYLELAEVQELSENHRKKDHLYEIDFALVLKEMQRLKASLIVAGYYRKDTHIIFALGEKRSEEPYREEEITPFQTLVQETSIAIENARLYDERIREKEVAEKTSEELKKMQAEIIHVKEEAAIAEVTGGINHDIRHGTGAIAGAMEIVKAHYASMAETLAVRHKSKRPITDEDIKKIFLGLEESGEYLDIIDMAAGNIDALANTLKQDGLGAKAQMGMLSVGLVLTRAAKIGMIRTYNDQTAHEKLIKPPQITVERGLPPVRGHMELLKSVFVNLLKNSIYALKGVDHPSVEISASRDTQDKDMVRVEFSDNGSGIEKDVLSKIFDYEFTTKGDRGEGKGLYNVKAIIEEQHHGRIEVVSEVGKGTTFIIKLPIWKEEP